MVASRRRARNRRALRIPPRRRSRAAAGSALSPTARRCARGIRGVRRRRLRLERCGMGGTAARRRPGLRTAPRHVHAGGDARRRDHAPASPGAAGGDARRAASGQRLQRALELGLRRSALVRGARGVRGPCRVPAVRGCRARARARRGAGRGLQPPRSERQLPAPVRPLPARGREHGVGRLGQPRRTGRARLHHRQRPDVVAGLPCRRAASRCGACSARSEPCAHPPRTRRTRRRAVGAARSSARPDRRVRPQRSDAHPAP